MKFDFNQIGNINTVCFTGHRPKDLHGYIREPYQHLVAELSDLLYGLVRYNGASRFISGGAQGFDQLAFWAVEHCIGKISAGPDRLNQIVSNEVFVPFPGQADIWSKTGAFSQTDYRLMTSRATRTSYVVDRKPTDKSGVVGALHSRNHSMVQNSDLVIALWAKLDQDPLADNTKGGTAECIKFARKSGKPVLVLEYNITSQSLLSVNLLR